MLAQLVSVALTASVKATDTKSVSSFNHFQYKIDKISICKNNIFGEGKNWRICWIYRYPINIKILWKGIYKLSILKWALASEKQHRLYVDIKSTL